MAAASSIPFHFLFFVSRLVNNCSSDYPTVSQHNLTTMTVVTLDYCNGQLPRERPYVGTWSIDRRSYEDDPMTELELHGLTELTNYNSMCFRRNGGTDILGSKAKLPQKGGFFANGTWAFCPCSSRDDEPRTDGGTTPSKLGVHFAASNAPDACGDYRALATPGTFLEEHGTRLLSLFDVSPDYINDQVPGALARKLLVGHDNTTKVEPGHLKEVTSKERKFGVGARVATAASALLGLFCTVSGLLCWCMFRKKRRGTESVEDPPILQPDQLFPGMGPIRYTYSVLVAATSNFAEEKMLGKGGFGPVYQGYLNDQSRHVAVKMFSPGSSSQGRKEFEAEVKIMSRLRHRNLVQLVGWCDRQRHLLLVYELVPRGSLDKHLHDPERILTWAERYRIALGLGSAILYLHTECDQCVVHGDIKTSNVMLDSSRDAKLGDFGLARLVPHGDEPQTTEVVAGTVGYMDPEFVASQKRGTESDIYSFGVVLLEIACGRRPASLGQRKEASMLLKRVRDMYDRNAILDAADGRLNGEFDERQMERVLVTGLWCAHRERCRRPSIAQAMSVLRSDGNTVLPVLPESHGCGQVFRSFEEQAYGDLSPESDGSMGSSAATAYDTPEDWSCPLGEDS